MKLSYQATKIIDVSELPTMVHCEPIKIELKNFISTESMLQLKALTMDSEDVDTVLDAAGKFIVAVWDDDGIRHPIDSEFTVNDLVQATGIEFVAAIVTGWALVLAAEIKKKQNKSKKSAKPLNFTQKAS